MAGNKCRCPFNNVSVTGVRKSASDASCTCHTPVNCNNAGNVDVDIVYKNLVLTTATNSTCRALANNECRQPDNTTRKMENDYARTASNNALCVTLPTTHCKGTDQVGIVMGWR